MDLTPAAQRWGLAGRRLYLCTPDRPDLEEFLAACLDGGVDIVQLRDKNLDDDALVARARIARAVCAARDVPFVVNDRPDVALAAGADGVHVGQDDVAPDVARAALGPQALIGLSTHATSELDHVLAGAPAIDYLSAGPVVPTPTKPGRPGTGYAYVTEAVQRSPWPVWVTGGATPDTVGAMVAAGARHVVVVRWLTESKDPRADAAALIDAMDAAAR